MNKRTGSPCGTIVPLIKSFGDTQMRTKFLRRFFYFLISALVLNFGLQTKSSAENLSTARSPQQKLTVSFAYNEERLLIVDSENGSSFLMQIKVFSNGWQEVVSREIFSNQEQALAAMRASHALLQKQAQDEAKNPELPPRMASPVAGNGARSIWATAQEWNQDWENRYSQWVQNNRDPAFLSNHQIRTDCADVAIAYRWIFARINGLPAANTLAGTGRLITNESMNPAWTGLSTNQDWTRDQLF